MHEDVWRDMYKTGWKGLIVPEAFSHPAKFSRSLIQGIYRHAAYLGWLQAGDICLDPFGGVSLGGLDAALMGVQHIAMELEPAFHALACANITYWQQRYGHLSQWCTPVALCGDSRQVAAVLRDAAVMCVCTSPPYVHAVHGGNGIDASKLTGNPAGVHSQAFAEGYGASPGQLSTLPRGDLSLICTSPPYADGLSKENTYADDAKRFSDSQRRIMQEKGIVDPHSGRTSRQLTALPTGTLNAIVASPPYATGDSAGAEALTRRTDASAHAMRSAQGWTGGGQTSAGNLAAFPTGHINAVVSSPPYADGCAHTGGADPQPQYVKGGTVHHVACGATPGQLARCVVCSPPFEDCLPSGGTAANMKARWQRSALGGNWSQTYGMSAGQLGVEHGDTFWSAAAIIVRQCWELLPHGAHAIFVCKDYVRDGQRVPFSAQWLALCQHIGFTPVHWHRALLVAQHGTQATLFGGDEHVITEKKGFFRHLAEKRGAPKVDCEDILCLVKREHTGDPPCPCSVDETRSQGVKL